MKLHVFPPSPNAKKAMMVNQITGLNLPQEVVDLQADAQKTEVFLGLNPNGKIPVLEYDDGSTLWESNAIINRLAAEAESPLWPKSNIRYDILRWQFWEACHWTPACAPYISRHLFGNESVDLEAAGEDFHRYAKVLDTHLKGRTWLVGEAMTTADISVCAILAYAQPCQYPLADYAEINRWFGAMSGTDAWAAANPAPQAA